MDRLYIKESEYCPEIILDADENLISFIGQSYPENTFEFYKPVLNWIQKYSERSPKKIKVILELVYLNSSSFKAFFDVIDLLDEARKKYNSSIDIEWIYDKDNDIALETGEDFQDDFKALKIKLVEKK